MTYLLRIFAIGLTVLSLHATAKGNSDESPQLDPSAPLGTPENPVRASMPLGELDFFMRLRCLEGDAPSFERQGSIGRGPYGNIVDAYRVTCRSGRVSTVVIDMYHRHRETGHISGFTTLPEHPAKLADGCPPKVDGAATGSYIFHRLEVERPAHIAAIKTDLESHDAEGYVFVRFVIGRDGQVSSETIEYPNHDLAPELKDVVAKYLRSLQFTPAEHRVGCPVPQKAEIGFTVSRK